MQISLTLQLLARLRDIDFEEEEEFEEYFNINQSQLLSCIRTASSILPHAVSGVVIVSEYGNGMHQSIEFAANQVIEMLRIQPTEFDFDKSGAISKTSILSAAWVS